MTPEEEDPSVWVVQGEEPYCDPCVLHVCATRYLAAKRLAEIAEKHGGVTDWDQTHGRLILVETKSGYEAHARREWLETE